MTDAEMSECEFCGDEFKTQGLAAHQRYCDEKSTEADESDGGESKDDSSDVGENGPSTDERNAGSEATQKSHDNLDQLDRDTFERDDWECLGCGATDELVSHTVDVCELPRLANRITLCQWCDEEFANYHPLTKRTKAFY